MAKKGEKLSLKQGAKGLVAYAGKGIVKHINNLANHDGVHKMMIIAGIGAATMIVSPLVVVGVGGLSAFKWAADKLSSDPAKKNKGVLNEFMDITGYGANVIGKASELILSPRLADLSQSIDDWEHGIKPNEPSPEPEPEP